MRPTQRLAPRRGGPGPRAPGPGPRASSPEVGQGDADGVTKWAGGPQHLLGFAELSYNQQAKVLQACAAVEAEGRGQREDVPAAEDAFSEAAELTPEKRRRLEGSPPSARKLAASAAAAGRGR